MLVPRTETLAAAVARRGSGPRVEAAACQLHGREFATRSGTGLTRGLGEWDHWNTLGQPGHDKPPLDVVAPTRDPDPA